MLTTNFTKPITLQTKNAECNKHRVDAIVVRAYFRLGQFGKELPCQDFLSPDSNLPMPIKRTKCS
ncbi:hypothetical protein GNP84_18875 [Aliivibrio fischeri]|uniref:hypothetical protein n=1 Tax=Aliivibrio fischeri TaxID=668 RepID=UPI0012D8F1A8|nr:hypothetical protein [Aliivibrio fischeri]MUK78947.1 hypothetical protein [Aliivibrio fischeri]